MYDEIITALVSGRDTRRLEPAVLGRLAEFFRVRMEELLPTAARMHPLGFVYATDIPYEGVDLRYHLWPASYVASAVESVADIHDHSYELNSLVVAGELLHETFVAEEHRDGPYELLEVNYADSASQLRQTGRRCALRQDSEARHVAGTAYRLNPGHIHRVRTFGGLCATLVATRLTDSNRTPRVLLPAGAQIPTPNERPRLTPRELYDARSALAEIAAVS